MRKLNAEKLNRTLRARLDENLAVCRISGAQLLVRQGGETLCELKAGYQDVRTREPLRDDAINMRVQAYRDSARSSLAFVGTGVTELRQVKVMLAAGASADDYNSTIIPASPKAFADTEADGRDIFIYYVVRNYTVN